MRNAPGAWPKRLPISLALPKLQGKADQVAGAAQGGKMDFWKLALMGFAGSVCAAVVPTIWKSDWKPVKKLLAIGCIGLVVICLGVFLLSYPMNQ